MNNDYPIKQIYFFNKSVCVLCQQENGPCPLLAIANCLLLTDRISLPPDVPSITPQYLLNLLGDYLMERTALHADPDIRVQQQDQISTAIQLLPRLLEGMVVDIDQRHLMYTCPHILLYTRRTSMFTSAERINLSSRRNSMFSTPSVYPSTTGGCWTTRTRPRRPRSKIWPTMSF